MTNQHSDTSYEIDAFLERWTAAELAGDVTPMADLLTDDFIGVGPLGFLLRRQDWLDRHVDHALDYDEFRLDERQVRSYGEHTVVVIGHQVGNGNYRGNPLPGHVRATLVLVKQTDGWRLASIQMSFMAGTPGAPPIPGRG